MDNEIDVTIGFNLHNMRKARGMTQAALGGACEDGISSQQISKYELGENSINCTRLVEFAKILRYNLLDFFDGVKKL